jgi:hypothetical protein
MHRRRLRKFGNHRTIRLSVNQRMKMLRRRPWWKREDYRR